VGGKPDPACSDSARHAAHCTERTVLNLKSLGAIADLFPVINRKLGQRPGPYPVLLMLLA
jgi:hypothetical protein